MYALELLDKVQRLLNISVSEDIEKGIDVLLSIVDHDSDLVLEIYQLRGKFNEIEQDSEDGMVSYKDKVFFSNEIRAAILKIIDNLKITQLNSNAEFWSMEEKTILRDSEIKIMPRHTFADIRITSEPKNLFSHDDLEIFKTRHQKVLTNYPRIYRSISALVFRNSGKDLNEITNWMNALNKYLEPMDQFRLGVEVFKNSEKELRSTDQWDYYKLIIRKFRDYMQTLELEQIDSIRSKVKELSQFTHEVSFSEEKKPDSETIYESELTKILFLSANPKNTSQLRLGEELRKIKDSLSASTHRDHFTLVSESAVRIATITKAMQSQHPGIVHFAGHGLGEDGIVVENDVGDIVKFPTVGLDRLFRLCTKHVDCVVLNACYSKEQAEVISRHGIYVVGMNKAVGDKSALDFSVGFYQSLGEGNNIEFAFDMAMVTNSVNLRDADTPELWLDGRIIKK